MLSRDVGNYRLFPKLLNGKIRDIQEPKRRLQKLHLRVHKLLSRVEVPSYLHSAVRGRSYLTNANAHDPAVPAIKIDVKKFFQSVPREAIRRFFSDTLMCRSDVAGLLSDILTYRAHLPTGSSASPIMAYYAFKQMFDQIEALARLRRVDMTCYVDDMTMSGANATRQLLYEVHKLVATHGLRTHKMHYFRANQPRVITGVCGTRAGRRVPNKLHLRIKQGFDRWRDAANPIEKEAALRTLFGSALCGRAD
jgi:hypothetical protein